MEAISFLVPWVALTAGIAIAARLLPGMELKGGVGSYFLVSGAFGLTLSLTGWFFHLMLGFLSLGLLFFFGFVAQVLVAAVVLKITDAIFERLSVEGIGTALSAGFIISMTDTVVRLLLR